MNLSNVPDRNEEDVRRNAVVAVLPLKDDEPLPPVETAQTTPNGLLAVSPDFSTKRLIEAYSRGIYPVCGPGEPMMWWSPDPRAVIFPAELKVSTSLARTVRNGNFEIRFDTAFREVITACSEPRKGMSGSWITSDVIDGYCALHEQGHAHCAEVWSDGKLVGGTYGVTIGRMFYGESMFSRVSNASKVSFVHLVSLLRSLDFGLIDCQILSPHLATFGAREIPRAEFGRLVAELTARPPAPLNWTSIPTGSVPAATS